MIENRDDIIQLLKNTHELLNRIQNKRLVVHAPIGFDKSFKEIESAYGILEKIRTQKSFIEGTHGYEMISSIKNSFPNIVTLKRRRSLNAFYGTDLNKLLKEHKISKIFVAGIFTSICIDSTARTAYELGYEVHIVEDMIAGTTQFETKYYIDNIFPMYAKITKSNQIT